MPGTPDGGGHKLEFRVGGTESLAATFAPTGERSEHMAYCSWFLDIVTNERIVYS